VLTPYFISAAWYRFYLDFKSYPRRIKQFDLICVTGMTLSHQRQVDAACRKHGVRFFAADCHGLFASIFLDLNTHDYTIEIKRKTDDVRSRAPPRTPSRKRPAPTHTSFVEIQQRWEACFEDMVPSYHCGLTWPEYVNALPTFPTCGRIEDATPLLGGTAITAKNNIS
jgi:hypothetical protein